jgi:hypothetical protein
MVVADWSLPIEKEKSADYGGDCRKGYTSKDAIDHILYEFSSQPGRYEEASP